MLLITMMVDDGIHMSCPDNVSEVAVAKGSNKIVPVDAKKITNDPSKEAKIYEWYERGHFCCCVGLIGRREFCGYIVYDVAGI